LESRDENLSKTLLNGQELIPVVDDKDLVKDRLYRLETERDRLGSLWIQKDRLLTERLKYQIFMRDADQMEAWLKKQEAFLAATNLGNTF
jgi:hypothetical protein